VPITGGLSAIADLLVPIGSPRHSTWLNRRLISKV